MAEPQSIDQDKGQRIALENRLREMSIESVLDEQKTLEKLCGDRPSETNEKFPANHFYGMSSILKSYAGIDLTKPLNVAIPHGINLSDTFVWHSEVKAAVPAIFYHSPQTKRSYAKAIQEQGVQKILLPCASPFLYVVEQLKEQPQPERTGTIFFPAHSTHHITAEMNYEMLAETLTTLPEEFQPVTVCLYWKDYLMGRAEPFKARGMTVVSAGHIYDPTFLYRLYHLCSTHKYSSSNEAGSHIFYSIKSGCSYFYLDSEKPIYSVNNDVPVSSGGETTVNEIKALFRQPQASMNEAQLKFIDSHMGTAYLKSPEALRHQLNQLDSLAGMILKPKAFLELEDSDISGQLDQIPSETSQAERRFLYQFFSKIWTGRGDVCEIGPFLGGTTRAIALGMLHNPKRQNESRLYTYDRFEDYYDGDRLIEYLKPAFQEGLLDQEFTTILKESNSFLEVFKALHQEQNYFSLIEPIDQALPGHKSELANSSNLFTLPSDSTFGAIFVDGCKSWYGTKYFMQQVCPRATEGAIFIFQDYGWHTCFWLPVFLQRFKNYFNLLTFVGGNTFVFQLVESLDFDTIDEKFPDEPEGFESSVFHHIFSELILEAQARNTPLHRLTYTLQYCAALAYIGCIEQAKVILLGLVAQPWTKNYQQRLSLALKSLTYRPGGETVSLYSDSEAEDLIKKADKINQQALRSLMPQPQPQSQQQKTGQESSSQEAELKKVKQELAIAQQKTSQLIASLEQQQSQTHQLQKVVAQKRKRLKKIKRQRKKAIVRVRKTVRQQRKVIQELNQQLEWLKGSKFWRLRNLWFRFIRRE